MANKTVDQVVADLRQQRDELRLQMHLAKAEAKEEWEALEKKWQHLESRLGRAAGEAKASAHNVGAAMDTVAAELGAAYQRIKNSLR
jgi:chromosome segregation ATPase